MPTITEIEKELGWTEEDASMCGCYIRPEPCENCWTLGWRLGADDVVDDKQQAPYKSNGSEED